jgi:hypothetical protein
MVFRPVDVRGERARGEDGRGVPLWPFGAFVCTDRLGVVDPLVWGS